MGARLRRGRRRVRDSVLRELVGGQGWKDLADPASHARLPPINLVKVYEERGGGGPYPPRGEGEPP